MIKRRKGFFRANGFVSVGLFVSAVFFCVSSGAVASSEKKVASLQKRYCGKHLLERSMVYAEASGSAKDISYDYLCHITDYYLTKPFSSFLKGDDFGLKRGSYIEAIRLCSMTPPSSISLFNGKDNLMGPARSIWWDNCGKMVKELKAKTVVALEKKKKEQELLAKKRAEKERVEKLAAEKERQRVKLAKKAAKEAAFEALVPVDKHRVVWGGGEGYRGSISTGSESHVWNSVNLLYQDSLESSSGSGASFDPPSRGEFEKSQDFVARVKRLLAEHEKEKAKLARDALEKSTDYLRDAMNKGLGSPELVALRYDADKEQFSVTVGNSIWKGVSGIKRVPIDDAPSFKKTYSKANVFLVFERKGERLSPKGIVLQSGEHTDYFSPVTGSVPVRFNAETRTGFLAEKEGERAEEKRLAKVELKKAIAEGRARKVWYVKYGGIICGSVYDMTKLDSGYGLPKSCWRTREEKTLSSISGGSGSSYATIRINGDYEDNFTERKHIDYKWIY